MLYEELRQIIRSVMEQGLRGQTLMAALTATVNPTEIYASGDMLITDSYLHKARQIVANRALTGRKSNMIKVLFICHGTIL